MTDKVSFIIPAYNAEKYIKQTIDSCLNQNYPDIEIIVVNDGSTDGTWNEISKYLDKSEIKVINYMQNYGTAKALNTGIRFSTGKWIHWLSADDELYHDCITKMMKYLSLYDGSENCIWYTDYSYIDETGTITGEFKDIDTYEWSTDNIQKMLYDHFFGNASSSLIHRDIFVKCGLFDESLPFAEDYEFWLRASLIYGVELRHIPETTLKYRIHPEQMTKIIGDRIGPINRLIKDKILNQLSPERQLVFASC